MPRAKNVPTRLRRKKRVLKRAKGYRGGRHRLYRTAMESVLRADAFAYRDRRQRKRNFRSLWITRIAAACRSRNLSYSRFIKGLADANVELNRKMLAETAVNDPACFDRLVTLAQAGPA